MRETTRDSVGTCAFRIFHERWNYTVHEICVSIRFAIRLRSRTRDGNCPRQRRKWGIKRAEMDISEGFAFSRIRARVRNVRAIFSRRVQTLSFYLGLFSAPTFVSKKNRRTRRLMTDLDIYVYSNSRVSFAGAPFPTRA